MPYGGPNAVNHVAVAGDRRGRNAFPTIGRLAVKRWNWRYGDRTEPAHSKMDNMPRYSAAEDVVPLLLSTG